MADAERVRNHTGETVASATERLIVIYKNLGEQSLKFRPPLFTDARLHTPDIVYHELPGNASFHIGEANPENTPLAMRAARRKADFCFWYNLRHHSGIVTTPYYLCTNTLALGERHILTPKGPKRFHSLEPGQDSDRWEKLLEIISAAEAELWPGAGKPDQSHQLSP